MAGKKELTVHELTILKLTCEKDILIHINNSINEFRNITDKQIEGVNVSFIENVRMGMSKEFILTGVKIDINIFD